MNIMNNCFYDEITKTVKDIKKVRTDDCICFAMLSNSKLADSGDDTRKNIKAVDNEIGFDFIAHLGDITNGDNPEKITRYLLATECEKYKKSIKSNKLFVTQGANDGYRDERFAGQLAMHIMTDEIWCAETEFIDMYDNVFRKSGKSYYYVDIPEKKTRLIFLCSYYSQIDKGYGYFEKYTTIDVEQAVWLKSTALNAPAGWTALIFSHAIPKSRFETGKDPFIYKGFSTEAILITLQQARDNGVNIAGWFCGAYGYDYNAIVGGINHISISSQAPYPVPTPKLEAAEILSDRAVGTVNQDCWDAVVLNPKTGEIDIFRFGSGEDRKLQF